MPRDIHSYKTFEDDDALSPFHINRFPEGFTYCVAWRDGHRDVVKVGETLRPARWRHYISRGASVVLIFQSQCSESLQLESRMHAALGASYPLAFTDREEAKRILGSSGGWRETYEVPRFIVKAYMEGEIRALVQGR